MNDFFAVVRMVLLLPVGVFASIFAIGAVVSLLHGEILGAVLNALLSWALFSISNK